MTIPLDASEWLLNYDPATHDGNLVTPLIDGANYLPLLLNDLYSLDPDDFFYCAAWSIDAGVWLSQTATLREALGVAASSQAKVRFLLYKGGQDQWYDEYYYTDRAAPSHREFVNEIDLIGHEAIIDFRHPLPEGSHHGKYVVVGKQDGSGEYVLTAYVGGIDIAGGRWAYDDHDPPSTRQDPYGAWHDVQCKIEGPVAYELLEHFENRWNQHPTEAIWVDALPVKTETTTARAASSFPIRGTPVGTMAAQHLFTYPCHPNNLPSGRSQTEYEADAYYAFVPRGMRTIEEAIFNAIRRARVYIYLENYAFYHLGIASEIAARLDAQPELQVIYVGDYDVKRIFRPATQDAYAIVAGATNNANFGAFDLRPPNRLYNPADPDYMDDNYPEWIYPHGKLMIVDDCWATVGSANFNHRSMTTDGEANIGFVDLDPNNPIDAETDIRVSAGVRAFRQQLWAEHLQLDATDPRLEHMLTALETWNERAQTVPHTPSVDPDDTARVFRQNIALRNWEYWSQPASYSPIWSYIDPETPFP
jgi:phosphatidylserine/phosphatidylglycerophosphate/cardiolipin synthase-like enzyme